MRETLLSWWRHPEVFRGRAAAWTSERRVHPDVRHLFRSRPDYREIVGPSFCKERMHGADRSLYMWGRAGYPLGAARPGSSQGQARVVRPSLRRCRSPCEERWGDSPPCESSRMAGPSVRHLFRRSPIPRGVGLLSFLPPVAECLSGWNKDAKERSKWHIHRTQSEGGA